jgi:hypothetical protein
MAKKLDNPVIDIKTGRPVSTLEDKIAEAQALYDEYHTEISDEELFDAPKLAEVREHIKTVPVPNNIISMAQFKEKRDK